MRLTQFKYESFGSIRFQFLRMGLGVGFLAFTFVAFAAETDAMKAGSPDWLQLGLELFGGLALFLAGLL